MVVVVATLLHFNSVDGGNTNGVFDNPWDIEGMSDQLEQSIPQLILIFCLQTTEIIEVFHDDSFLKTPLVNFQSTEGSQTPESANHSR